MSRILIIDPDSGRQASLRSRVQDEGYEVAVLESPEQATAQIQQVHPDLVLLAEELEGAQNGYETARRIVKAHGPALPILLCSSLPSTSEHIERALLAGCHGFLGRTEVGALGPILSSALARKAEFDELGERHKALEAEARRLREGAEADPVAGTEDLSAARAVDSTPAGAVLIVDGFGVVQQADRGACELLGGQLQGRSLGSLLPSTGLEAFVRDTRTERRQGFRFYIDTRDRRRSLVASVTPLSPSVGGDPRSGMRVVSMHDAPRGPVGASSVPETAMHHELASLLENAREMFRPESFIGQSPLARGLRMTVAELIDTDDVPILIQGPRGTGKELLGRILHYSGRATGPFLRLCCSALVPAHLERELFGSPDEDGSSTGGLWQLANRGTLFLEEVGELPMPLQERLLKELSDPANTDGSRSMRLVVSSSEDLRTLVARDRFMEPLYQRLRTHELVTTGLSARPEDLLELVQHYLSRYGSSKGIFSVSGDALQALQRHAWPANVDELADCIEQACAKARGKEVQLEDLSRAVRSVGVGPTAAPSLVSKLPLANSIGKPLGTANTVRPGGWEPQPWEITDSDPINLDHYQKKALLRALARCQGDKVAAAKLLNVGKSTFYRKLKRYGITEVPDASLR